MNIALLSPFWAMLVPFLLAWIVVLAVAIILGRYIKKGRSNRSGVSAGIVLFLVLYPVISLALSFSFPDLSGTAGTGDNVDQALAVFLGVVPIVFFLWMLGLLATAGVVGVLAEPVPLTFTSGAVKFWKGMRWVLLAIVAVYVVIGTLGYVHLENRDKTAAAVARIHATRLTWPDINGTLPSVPDPTANNATLAGVDSNNNGIRDDVERAIYNAHKDDEKLAVAELQYAKELQMEFTQVFNSETLVAVLQEEGRGSLCILDIAKEKEVENLVFNTPARKQAREELFNKYMTSFGLLNNSECDISL